MTILFAASEMTPLARTGGLGDVIEALPASLAARGHDVSVILPCYRGLRENPKLEVRPTGVRVPVGVGNKPLDAEVLECTGPAGVQVFLIRRDEYFDRPSIYGESGGAYGDNAERFIFFSRAVVELSRRLLPQPEILHLHDWQTALVAALVKERRLPFKTVLTIHNIAYQGSFWAFDFGLTRLPGDYFAPGKGLEFYGNMNLLKGGIVMADAVTTVSERHAREIQTAEYGFGLDAVMRENSWKLSGILNGADYEVWNPATDSLLPARFSPEDLSGKQTCREALLSETGLEPDPKGPVFAMVTRLASQKGLELLFPVLDRLLADDVRLVILGEGDPAYERELLIASKRHFGRFAYCKDMNERLSHLIEGGADVTLYPSFYEPCGLTAMYSLEYGALPIARATGGLYEIIQDFDPTTGAGNGFLFFEANAEALWDAIVRVKRLFQDKPTWRELMTRSMKCDFSWTHATQKYEALYRNLLSGKR
ncbi:MAG TPA: glycogen synthase GlgA [Chthoniobacteraceae bacterium]|jgi:starch synthase